MCLLRSDAYAFLQQRSWDTSEIVELLDRLNPGSHIFIFCSAWISALSPMLAPMESCWHSRGSLSRTRLDCAMSCA